MKRFFCPKENIKWDRIIIRDKEEIHHILSVMRQKKGDVINIFDGRGNDYCGRICEINKDKIAVKISKKDRSFSKENFLCIACAIPKKSKFGQIVERCTELGVDKIVPIITERTIIKLSREQRIKKLAHWQKIAIAACKQSGRKLLIEIEDVKIFKDALGQISNYDLAVIPCLQKQNKELKAMLQSFKGKNIIVFIGPEGDFTKNEISEAVKRGCQPVSLGTDVLRVETAVTFIASVFKYVFNPNG